MDNMSKALTPILSKNFTPYPISQGNVFLISKDKLNLFLYAFMPKKKYPTKKMIEAMASPKQKEKFILLFQQVDSIFDIFVTK